MPDEPKKLDPVLQKCLKDILEKCEQEESTHRKYQVRRCKKNEEYWHGIQQLFWDEENGQFSVPTNESVYGSDAPEEVRGFYDFVINVYKPHGEAIISALAAEIPTVRFYPHDPDNSDDRSSAKNAVNVVDLISRHNKIKLLWLKALFILFNQDFVASYVYHKKDKKYGSVSVDKYGLVKSPGETSNLCTTCDSEVKGDVENCPDCGAKLDPALATVGPEQEAMDVIETNTEDKGREILDIFGPLNVKIPCYARKQEDIGYLIQYADQNYAMVKDMYKELRDKIESSEYENEKHLRRPSVGGETYGDSTSSNLVTVKKIWIRPWAFELLGKEKRVEIDKLKETFPDGCHFTFVESHYADSQNEDLDDHWTITAGTLSRFIHGDPLGQGLISIQDIRNDLVNLIIQTIKHGIPSTYADPSVVNFDQFASRENIPGNVFRAKAEIPGQDLSNYIFQERTATFPREVQVFADSIDNDAQFVTGSFPAIYGGPQESGSKTLGEYTTAGEKALRRLSITWEFLVDWFGETMAKAVKLFIEYQVEDESIAKPTGPDEYSRVMIRKDSLQGSFDRLDAVGTTAFPTSPTQKRNVLMQMLTMGNPEILQTLFSSGNVRHVQEILGINNLTVPGELQRTKQVREISDLLEGVPSEPDGQGTPPLSTIPVEMEVDDHGVHIQTLKNFLVSDIGQDVKELSPVGYMNCIYHIKEHQQAIALLMQEQTTESPVGEPPATALVKEAE